MNPLLLGGILDVGKTLIKSLFPDPEEQAKAELQLQLLQQNGDLKELETKLSAIVMEAKSKDPWTSRARPSFLYVMYAMILASIPMGVLHAFNPELAVGIATGMQNWLNAIPGEMWALFGAGYMGYTWHRSKDKANILGVLK